MTPPTGILLINLGTPSAPDRQSVRAYLSEFLSAPSSNRFTNSFPPAFSARIYSAISAQNLGSCLSANLDGGRFAIASV